MNQVGASRLRGFVASLLALVLSVSVLTLVASSPAGAANTASEALFDHDNNPATANVRQFAGANRYSTSLAVARGFVSSVGSGGFVDSVIIASGESLIDAAAAAGLAGSKSAPVLLTTPNSLPAAVENFIIDEFISDVYIVGGINAVSQAVEDTLTGLAPVQSVTRLSGEDRYATSAVIADEVGSGGVYCDTGQPAAIIANIDSTFADVIAVGPLAYSLELPVLLTAADNLPGDVRGYLVDTDIERVIIIGGENAVSPAVADEIGAAGISDVTRIAGANRFDTALQILRALQRCSTVAVSPTTIALINGNSAADGVSAGPLLGRGRGVNDGVTPALLVTADNLPEETRNYLASAFPTRNRQNQLLDISITAIGGAAAVSDEVMQAALRAATTSPPLTASIVPRADENTPGKGRVLITFSGPVNMAANPGADSTDEAARAAWASSALNPSHYRVGGSPLLTVDTVSGSANPPSVNITLGDGQLLTAGDTITVTGGTITSSNPLDRRRVEPAAFTVARLTPDSTRPRVRIVAPDDGHELLIVVEETQLAQGSTFDLSQLTINDVALPTDAPASTAPAFLSDFTGVSSTGAQYLICLYGTSSDGRSCPTTASERVAALADGDRVAIEAGAFTDLAGNENRAVSVRVSANSDAPRVIRATVTRPTIYDRNGAAPGGQANARWGWQEYDYRFYSAISACADGETEVVWNMRFSYVIGITDVVRTGNGLVQCLAAGVTPPSVGDSFNWHDSFNSGPLDSTSDQFCGGEPIPEGMFCFRQGNLVTLPVLSEFPGAQQLTDFPGYTELGDTHLLTVIRGTVTQVRPISLNFEPFGLVLTTNYLTLTSRSGGAAAGAAGNEWSVQWREIPEDETDTPVAVAVHEGRKFVQISFEQGTNLLTLALALQENEALNELFSVSSDALGDPTDENVRLVGATIVSLQDTERPLPPPEILPRDQELLEFFGIADFCSDVYALPTQTLTDLLTAEVARLEGDIAVATPGLAATNTNANQLLPTLNTTLPLDDGEVARINSELGRLVMIIGRTPQQQSQLIALDNLRLQAAIVRPLESALMEANELLLAYAAPNPDLVTLGRRACLNLRDTLEDGSQVVLWATLRERGAPTATRRFFENGESSVTLSLLYNDVLQNFNFCTVDEAPSLENFARRNVDPGSLRAAGDPRGSQGDLGPADFETRHLCSTVPTVIDDDADPDAADDQLALLAANVGSDDFPAATGWSAAQQQRTVMREITHVIRPTSPPPSGGPSSSGGFVFVISYDTTSCAEIFGSLFADLTNRLNAAVASSSSQAETALLNGLIAEVAAANAPVPSALPEGLIRRICSALLETTVERVPVSVPGGEPMPEPDGPTEFTYSYGQLLQPTLVREITFTLHASNPNQLPSSGDNINLPAGVATNYAGSTSAEGERRLIQGR